jgi:transcriptional regulator with XRE-family HTH domain
MDVKADRIRERRLLRGWSQEQFAQITGTTTRTIQRIAWQGASLETIKAVASALDCDFRELISLEASDPALDVERERQQQEFARHAQIRALHDDTLKQIVAYWNSKIQGFSLTDAGVSTVERWMGDYSTEEILGAIDVSARQYLRFSNEGSYAIESVREAFEKIPGICFVNRRAKEQPEIRDLYYVRGLLRNRIGGHFDNHKAIQWLSSAFREGVPVDELRGVALAVSSWTQFRCALEELIDRHRTLREEYASRTLPEVAKPISLLVSAPEADPSQEEPKRGLDYLAEATSVLKRCRERGEDWITIDFEDRVYYFGRSSDGYGTSYPINLCWRLTSWPERLSGTFGSSLVGEISGNGGIRPLLEGEGVLRSV